MKTHYLIAVTLFASIITGATAVQAQSNNPLHPSYFWGATKLQTSVHVGGDTVAIAPTNPLHPGYFAAKATGAPFVGAASLQSQSYVDHHNPLHPSYRSN